MATLDHTEEFPVPVGPRNQRPTGLWCCRACGEKWLGQQVNPDPRAPGFWLCGDHFCGGVVDRINESEGG